jgi:transcriptional antiterminator RfaH
MYWCCTRLEAHRENVAAHFLKLAGFETYFPRIREQRIRRHRRVEVIAPLFPAYGFVLITLQWHAARWAPGTCGLIMNGVAPARVPDHIIDEIRMRERNGAVELPKPLGLKPGDQVRILSGAFEGHLALYAGMKPHERVEVLLSFLGSQQRVTLRRDAVAAPTDADLTSGS